MVKFLRPGFATRGGLSKVMLVSALVAFVGLSGIRSAGATIVPLTPTAAPNTGGNSSTGEVTAELPPPDLPTTNEQGYTFDLDTSLKTDLQSVPQQAPVYKLDRDTPTTQSSQKIADSLGINAKVQDRGDGTFEASGNGELFISSDLTQYISDANVADGNLLKDDDAIQSARDWLRKVKLLPVDIGDGVVQNRSDEAKQLIVTFTPAEPQDVLSAYPSITVTEGPKGQVVEAAVRWANIVRADIYQLMPAQQAWQLVQSGQAYVDADLTKAKEDPGADIQGQATFTSVSIVYATSGPPGGEQFLQPVYFFQGKLSIDKKSGSFVIKAYVPALSNSGAPVG
jgi:hypothetical protein